MNRVRLTVALLVNATRGAMAKGKPFKKLSSLANAVGVEPKRLFLFVHNNRLHNALGVSPQHSTNPHMKFDAEVLIKARGTLSGLESRLEARGENVQDVVRLIKDAQAAPKVLGGRSYKPKCEGSETREVHELLDA